MEIIESAKEYHDQSNVVWEEIKDDLKVTAQPVITISKLLQKEVSGKRGAYIFLIWMVQLILEQIVNGTPPAAISPNILSKTAIDMPGVKVIVQDITSINFIRQFQTIISVIDETLAAHSIGIVDQLGKLFSNGTVRRQIVLQNLVIGIIH